MMAACTSSDDDSDAGRQQLPQSCRGPHCKPPSYCCILLHFIQLGDNTHTVREVVLDNASLHVMLCTLGATS